MLDPESETVGGKKQNTISNLKQVALELSDTIGRFENQEVPEQYRGLLSDSAMQSRKLIGEIDLYINNVVSDLEQSGEELKKSSKHILGRVSEQLEKVSESAQIAVNSVLNRIDRICERQNSVFEQIAGLREKMGGATASLDSAAVLEVLGRIEGLEGEIQNDAFEIMNEMQFQDIMSQQIQLAKQLLDEARRKLLDFRNVLSAFNGNAEQAGAGNSSAGSFDPGATIKDRENRQRVADEVSADFLHSPGENE